MKMTYTIQQKILFYHKKACEYGFYGVDCKEICGQCRDIDQCFHTNGTCLTGCVAGYQEQSCKTSEYMSRLDIDKRHYVF